MIYGLNYTQEKLKMIQVDLSMSFWENIKMVKLVDSIIGYNFNYKKKKEW